MSRRSIAWRCATLLIGAALTAAGLVAVHSDSRPVHRQVIVTYHPTRRSLDGLA